MPDQQMNKLYHWRYGPLTITSMIGTTFVTIVDDPGGIVRGSTDSWKSYIDLSPKNFESDKLGVYVFVDPNEVNQAPHFTLNLQHKFFTRNPKDNHLHELSELRTRSSILSETLLAKEVEKQHITNQLSDITYNLNAENQKMRKCQDDIKQSVNIIAEAKKSIKQFHETKSPREVKKILIKLPSLEQEITFHERKKAEYQAILLGTQEIIHQLILEQDKIKSKEIQLSLEIPIDKTELDKIRSKIQTLEEILGISEPEDI